MNSIDVLVFGLIALFMIIDGIRGFVKSIYLFVLLIIGFWLFGHYARYGVYFLKRWLPPIAAYLGSIIIVLFIAVVISHFFTFVLKLFLQVGIFKPLDRLLGVLVGIIKGFVIAALVLLVINIFHPLPYKLKRRSYTYHYVREFHRWMIKKIPKRWSLSLTLPLREIDGRNNQT